jgi:hypothetical protein
MSRGARKLVESWTSLTPGALAKSIPDLEIDGDIGAAEAVDRLFRIANDEQLPGLRIDCQPVRGGGIGRREEDQNLCLKRIGVLDSSMKMCVNRC